MASIARHRGKITVRWWNLSKKQQRRNCPSFAVAKQLKADIEATIALGRDWFPQVAGPITDLEEVTRAFIEHRALRLRERTVHRYGENLDLFIRFLRSRNPRGKISASMLSRPLLEDFYSWLCRPENGLHGRARSGDTARKIAEVAQLCWEWAEESERWVGDIPRPKRIEMVRSEPAPVSAPSWAEMDACVLACRNWHQKLAIFLRYTGLRVGESMFLLWSDVDMTAGTLTLREEIIKCGPGRTVPLCTHLLEELATWGVREGWLIPSGRKKGQRERQARPRDLNRAWQRAGVREGVWKGHPDHSFRKGIKTGLLNLGAQPDAIDHLQGHSLGHGSARACYIDTTQLRLHEAINLIPKIGATTTNVLVLPKHASG